MGLKKGNKKETSAPVMEIPVAQLKIVECELAEEPKEIARDDGTTWTADPNFNALLEVVDDYLEGDYDGMTFYERFKLKQDDDGEWELRDGTKFGALVKARYGQDFFNSEQEFKEEDFDDFVFQAKVQPKKNPTNGAVTGSTLNWETIMAVPKPKSKKSTKADKANEEDFDALKL